MASKRETLIQTSCKLFCSDGFNTTGIDKILKKAKVNKMTMYKYFKTKNDLIIATLDYAHDMFVKNIIEEIDKLDITPKEKIAKIFDILWEFTQKKKFVRCLFINASAEFPDFNDPIHKAAIQHKLSTEKYVKKLLDKMKIKDSKHLARVITALLQGALVMAQIVGDKDYYLDTKKVIGNLLKQKSY
ncbi:MAG TPA: TetR/AcrR family transcriptional regulator [Rickettsiales bacterium]|nr:TetR/AcrR family transcriptional regulator [Rickettsiales bacterium]